MTQKDHATDGLDRLITQYRESTNFRAFLTAFLDQSNDIEQMMIDTLEKRWLSTAEGVQLDVLGIILGRSRTVEAYDANPFFGFLTDIGSESFSTLASPTTGGLFYSLFYNRSNNFFDDVDVESAHRFEQDGWLTDPINGNDLTNSSQASQSNGEIGEGYYSAKFTGVYNSNLYITDSNLNSGHPLKSSGGMGDMSISFYVWFDPDMDGVLADIISKSTAGARCIYFRKNTDNKLEVIKSNNGLTEQTITFPTAFTIGRMYHVVFTYDVSLLAYRVSIYEVATETQLAADLTGTFSSGILLSTASLVYGRHPDYSNYFKGYLDEIVVFDKVLTITEIDNIRTLSYGDMTRLYESQALDDDTYRKFLYAKAMKNSKQIDVIDTISGVQFSADATTINNVLTIARALIPGADITLTEPETANFHLNFNDTLTDTEKLLMARTDFLSKPAGVNITFEDNSGVFE